MRSTASAAAWTTASVAPASIVKVLPAGSAARTRFRRSSDMTISPAPATGVWPPTRPVLPPWGTRTVPVSPARRTSAATSSVDPGRITAGVSPR